jgi:hypothetical protein
MAKKKYPAKRGHIWHQKKFSKKRSFVILFICISFYIVILLFYSLFSFYNAGYDGRALGFTISWDLQGFFNGNLFATPASTPVQVNIPAQIPSPTPTPQPIQSSQYTSKRLGISFYYDTFLSTSGGRNGGQRLYVREIGNTIYYYWDAKTNQAFDGNDQQFLNEMAPDSKYVEVFNKNPQQSLTDAIKQYIFQSPLPDGCYISTDTHYGEPNINTSYEQAFIIGQLTQTKPPYSGDMVKIYMPNCTKYATNYQGKSYFMMDPNHSDKFLYIKDGQDDIPSGHKGYMWDGTITIF